MKNLKQKHLTKKFIFGMILINLHEKMIEHILVQQYTINKHLIFTEISEWVHHQYTNFLLKIND